MREALLLQHEGLVVSDPKRRIRIAELSAADVEELCIARVALERTAIQVTVPRLESEEIAQLEGWMTQMDHFADGRDLDRHAIAATEALITHYSRTAFEVIGNLDPDYDPGHLRSATDAAFSTASRAS